MEKVSTRRLLPMLLLLVIVGAGAYVYLQGGSDYVMGLIDQFTGKKAKEDPLALRKRLRRKTSGWSNNLANVLIPSKAITGKLHGQAFSFDRAEIKDGILTIRQGKDFFIDRGVVIFLFTDKWELPFGKTFRIDKNSPGFGNPHIHMKWKQQGKSIPGTKIYTQDYVMLLQFGQEQNKQILGKIYISFPDNEKSYLAGTFRANIKGFRLINGRPDLTTDAFENLQFLALRQILKDDPKKNISSYAFSDTRISSRGAKDSKIEKTGYLEIKYRVGKGNPIIQRYQFVKENEWRYLRTLKRYHINEAHPLKIPMMDAALRDQIIYKTAKATEEYAKKRYPNSGIYHTRFKCSHNLDEKTASCAVSYKLKRQGMITIKDSYLFRLSTNGWILIRKMSKSEKYDRKAGKVTRI